MGCRQKRKQASVCALSCLSGGGQEGRTWNDPYSMLHSREVGDAEAGNGGDGF